MATETRCKDCPAFQKLRGLPKRKGYRFCVARGRQVVLAPEATSGHGLEDEVGAIRLDGVVSVYPVQHRNDVCFAAPELEE